MSSACDPYPTSDDPILFIVNPSAGASRNLDVPSLIKRAMANRRHEVILPDSPEALVTIIPKFLQQYPELKKVVIAGGDGTVMSTIPVLKDYEHLSIGLLPLGTGNLLAQNLGIPLDMNAALQVVLKGRCQPIDLCRMNEHYFVLNAGAGVDAEIMAKSERFGKEIFGVWAYVLEGARHVLFPKSYKFHIIADGKKIQARGLGVICFNAGSQVGAGVSIAPDVVPDDGYLYGTIFRIQGVFSFLRGFIQVLRNKSGHRRDPVQHFRAKHITISSRPKLCTQADGNVVGETPITLEVLPKQLSFLVP
jgi:diacylglycerol kinase (ATP)